jgi:hypothetical protein
MTTTDTNQSDAETVDLAFSQGGSVYVGSGYIKRFLVRRKDTNCYGYMLKGRRISERQAAEMIRGWANYNSRRAVKSSQSAEPAPTNPSDALAVIEAEQLARALEPALFSEDGHVAHRTASPWSVESARAKAIMKAGAVLREARPIIELRATTAEKRCAELEAAGRRLRETVRSLRVELHGPAIPEGATAGSIFDAALATSRHEGGGKP